MGEGARKVLERKLKDKQTGFVPTKRTRPPMEVILWPGETPHLAKYQGKPAFAVPELSPQGLLLMQEGEAFKSLSPQDQMDVIRQYKRNLATLPLLD
jgi:hypothetical protein